MPTERQASNTAALSFFQLAPPRSAGSAGWPAALRSAAESSSAPSATARASEESARSPFSVPKGVKPEEDAPKLITASTLLAASAEGKNSWRKYPQAQTALNEEPPDRPSHEPATESAPSRAVSPWVPTVSLQLGAGARCEPSLSLVGQVRP